MKRIFAPLALAAMLSAPAFGAGRRHRALRCPQDRPDTDDKKGMPGGINMLDLKSRIKYGCKLLGYSVQDGCSP
jgi:hypothetical protein